MRALARTLTRRAQQAPAISTAQAQKKNDDHHQRQGCGFKLCVDISAGRTGLQILVVRHETPTTAAIKQPSSRPGSFAFAALIISQTLPEDYDRLVDAYFHIFWWLYMTEKPSEDEKPRR